MQSWLTALRNEPSVGLCSKRWDVLNSFTEFIGEFLLEVLSKVTDKINDIFGPNKFVVLEWGLDRELTLPLGRQVGYTQVRLPFCHRANRETDSHSHVHLQLWVI